MKKLLLFTTLAISSIAGKSQCVYTCSNYAVAPITYSTFPSGTLNVTPQFTNPVLGTWADDGSIGPIPIGFSFDFYCNTYQNVYICSNGFIQFDYQPLPWPNQYVHPTQFLPDATVPNGMIAFNMTDLDPGVGGSITYTTVGTTPNRMFIVTFEDVPCFGQTDLNTGQIILRESSNIIEIHTKKAKACTNQSLGSTQGIENTNGTMAVTPHNRNGNSTWPNSANNTAYIFMPYSAAPLSAISGNTLLCEGDVANFVVPSATGAQGYNWTGPTGWIGSSSTTAVSFTATATGAISVTANYTCGVSPASTLAVTVLPAPVVAITSVTPAIICSGKSVQINMTGASVYTLEPGTSIGQSPFTDTPMSTVVYTVIGTDAAGCNSLKSATASVLVLESPTVSVNSGSVCQGNPFIITPSGASTYSYVNTPFSTVNQTVVGVHEYTVIGTNVLNGCKSQAVSTLSVIGLPPTAVSADRSPICRNETATLTAFGASSYAFSSSTVTGSSNVEIKPLFTAVHTVTGTSTEGCTRTATVQVVVNACTGLNESAATAAFKLYPNPTSGELNIDMNEAEKIVIIDLLGRKVKTVQLQAGNNKVVLDLPAGRYFLKGENSGTHSGFVITKE